MTVFNGGALRQHRMQKGMSAKQLAGVIGVSRGYINLIESGKRQPNRDYQKKLADFFEVQICEFTEVVVKDRALEYEKVVYSSGGRNIESPTVNLVQQSPTLSLSTVMLLSLIRGALADVTVSVRRGQPFQLHSCIQGVVEEDEVNGCDSEFFKIQMDKTIVSLRLSNPTSAESWLRECALFCKRPDVLLTSMFDFESGSDYKVEFVWFTEYVSVSDGVEQCRDWKLSDKRVTLLNPQLQTYMEQCPIWRNECKQHDVEDGWCEI